MSTAPAPGPNSPAKIPHPAACHCGLTRFTVHCPPLSTLEITSCNCSICVKHAYLLVYPAPADVVFESGYEDLQSYRFASGRWPHRFCGTCGASVLVDEGADWGVNVRLFEGVDVGALKLRREDGRSEHNPEYTN